MLIIRIFVGIYVHSPQENNNDVYIKEEGLYAIYWISNDNPSYGHWRVAYRSTVNSNSNPDSSSYGYGFENIRVNEHILNRFENNSEMEFSNDRNQLI